jgi:hypothetical protein
MTHSHFHSPALFRPELPHSIALARLLLAAVAVLFTVSTWMALGAQASLPADDDRVQVELPPVVISGHRAPGDGTPALMAARGAVECATPSASRMPGAGNGVTLEQ